MAESAANYRATLDAKPSIFEIIATNSLNSTLHPALQRVAVFLASVKPVQFNWLSQYYDEVFLGFNGLLQIHYLRTADASFSEYFYSLQRVSSSTGYSKLSNAHRHLSLLYLIALPYLRKKLEEKIETYKIQNAEGLLRINFMDICKRIILTTHSLFEVTYSIWTLLQYLEYMSGKSEYQTIPLKLLNLKLVYSSQLQDTSGFWMALFRGQLSMSELSYGLVQNTVQSFLELSAFFIQFLQVWNSEQTNYCLTSLPIVEPPPVDSKAINYKKKCPICLQYWKIPTCLPVSGYVFCFPCIIRHLRDHQYCPVTNLPAKPLDVIRLYDTE